GDAITPFRRRALCSHSDRVPTDVTVDIAATPDVTPCVTSAARMMVPQIPIRPADGCHEGFENSSNDDTVAQGINRHIVSIRPPRRPVQLIGCLLGALSLLNRPSGENRARG